MFPCHIYTLYITYEYSCKLGIYFVTLRVSCLRVKIKTRALYWIDTESKSAVFAHPVVDHQRFKFH